MNTAEPSQRPIDPAGKPIPRRGKKLRMFIWILASLAVLIIAFVIVVALQPADLVVTRSATFAAPPAVVFAQVNDFHNWQAWSPWAKLDPACRNTYEGASAGAGAGFSWAGNKDMGEGRMTITDSHPSDLIRINLDFVKPFPASNVAEFTFRPQGDQTVVTWTMTGRKNFISKAFCMFVSMDKMVGGDFEKGLASMKTVAESAAKK